MKSQTLIGMGYFHGLLNRLEDTKLGKDPHKKPYSDNSKSIKIEGDIASTLRDAFGLSNVSDSFRRAFEMATDGDGGEKQKILTIHSSSLLALMCFFSVSEKNPLKIGEDTYTEVLFEVKNIVIKKDDRKPSNIDVLLVSKNENGRIRKLLFLESKFTEYLKHGRVRLAPKYHKFYEKLQENIPGLKFEISQYNIRHRNGCKSTAVGLCSNKARYLDGIKQAFSHLLGIATGPAEDRNSHRKDYEKYYRQAEMIEFATIIHDWHKDEFDNYQSLYKETFQNEVEIKKALCEVVPNSNPEIINRLHINPKIMTYTGIFKDFSPPGIIKQVYKL